MAAGLGKRMQPVTLTTPKPLVPVNGVRMIDTVIRGLHANGIHEIYVVVGHLKEQFYQLEQEYPGVKIIENPYYDICNNISSLYVAREHLEYEFDVQKNRQIYWDDIALFCHPEDYQLGIQTMHTGDIIEIDNLQELADIDQRYAHYLNGGNTNE